MDLGLVQLEVWLMGMAEKIPLYFYVVFGAAFEEIVAPIPSPLVMTLAGSIAKVQDGHWFILVILAIVGGLSKTLASWLVYIIADRGEDLIVNKFGKFLGVSGGEIEGIGKYLGKKNRDWLVIFLARAIPIIPTAPVSVVCGLIKVNIKSYLWATLFGTIIRSLVYLILGYLGLASLENLLHGLDSAEKWVQIVLALVMGVALIWLFGKRKKWLRKKLEEGA